MFISQFNDSNNIYPKIEEAYKNILSIDYKMDKIPDMLKGKKDNSTLTDIVDENGHAAHRRE
jgi:hypothetical protein